MQPELHEIADFLSARPPFDSVDADDLARVEAATQIQFHSAGTVIFLQGAGPVGHLWVVRTGAVEIVHDGRVLDLLGPGELFGHGSMLSGLPTGFTARAAEDALCYRIRADVAAPLLARPAGVRFVARSLLQVVPESDDPPAHTASRPVRELVRSPLVVCPPATPIREAAQRMAEAQATSVVIDLGDGGLGILTDRDLRARVVAAGRDTSDPVSTAMSAPAYTVPADVSGGEALLDMLDRGIRHLPVLSPTGRVLGVVEDADLMAVVTRSSFQLRAALARAATVEQVAAAAARLRPAVIELHAARVPAAEVSAIQSVVVDAVVRRLLDLAEEAGDVPPVPFAWFALGSVARREAVPSSDVDSALIWFDDEGAPAEALRRSPGGWSTASRPAGSRPTRTARSPRGRCSPAPWPPGARRRGAGWSSPRRRRRSCWCPSRWTGGRCGASARACRCPTPSRTPAGSPSSCGCSPASRSPSARRPAGSATSWSRRAGSTGAGWTSSTAGSSRSWTSPAGRGWSRA